MTAATCHCILDNSCLALAIYAERLLQLQPSVLVSNLSRTVCGCRCDGPLLAAIKAGHWVLLDELNLAGQSVLEGLNAVLDHRAEVFIPELGQTFQCPPSFHLFAAQNPLQEGGGRKGLPKSFLNRFSRVHIQLLLSQDLLFIAGW